MSRLKLFLILILVSSSILPQNIGSWKIYSDMKDIKDAAIASDGVWAVSNGGAFRLNSSSDTSFIVLNKADGLVSQTLTSVGIDKNGKVWFGSQEGYIIVYNPEDKLLSSIPDIFKSNKTRKQINDIYFSGDTAFVATDFGLALINTSTLTFYDTFLKLGVFASETRILNTFKSGLVYALTENGVAIQKSGAQNLSAPESWNSYAFGGGIPAQSGSKLLSFNGEIIIAASNGIYRFVNGTWSLLTLQGNQVKDIAVSGNTLYAVTDKKLFSFSNNQLTQLFENQSVSLSSVSVQNNSIYLSSTNGLIEIKGSSIKYLSPNGPFSNLFINLSVSGSGNLYVATGKDVFGVGFLEFDGQTWKRYSKENSAQIPSNAFYNVYATENNTVYLSNWGNGFTIFKNGQFETYTAANSELVGIPANTNFIAISDVKVDSKGNIWIANHQSAARKPLSVLTPDKKWYHFSMTSPTLSEFDVLDKMVIDQFGTKWFVVIEGNRGLYYLNEKGTFTNSSDDTQGVLKQSDNLLSDIITSLAIDKRGYLWIGTSLGVNVITDPSKPKTTLYSNFALSIKNQSVTCIAVDALNQKWIGTKQGVAVISSDGYQLVDFFNTKNSPLPNDEIRSIAIDENLGRVYIGTDYGLVELQTSSIKPVESFDQLSVYPQPLVIDGSSAVQVTIDGLIKSSRIKILDISGNLIQEFTSPGGRVAFWDGRDLNGSYVPSGIYIIVANDEEANSVATGKVAVIRK